MIEAGGDKGVEFCLVERKPRRDEADVKSSGSSCANQFNDVRPSERLASGEIRLHNAELGRLPKHGNPRFGGKFRSTHGELLRIRTVHAM